MIERIAELVNADANLVRRGRFLNTTFLLEVGDAGYLVRIVDGRVVAVTPGPFITPNYSFALRAPREAWETFWQKVPPPGFNDIFALFKRGLLRIEGDLHPFMANLLYFKDVLAAPRRVAAMSPRFEPIVGRYLNLDLLGRPHRLYVEEAGAGHSAPLPAHRRDRTARQYRGLLNDPRITAELPRHRVRHAVARQVLAAGRLAGRGIPPHLARLCAA